jgi:hypothetical protein
LTPAGVQVEQRALEARVLLSAGLVHLLDDLEGQHDVRDLVGLAVPDQLYFALILEE